MNYPINAETPIRFAELIAAVVRHWLLIGVLVVVFTAGAVAAALLLTPIYRAEVLLAPVDAEPAQQSLSALTAGLGFAGISLQGDNSQEIYIATLKSRHFIGGFIEDQSLIPVLFHKKWDDEAGEWSIRNKDKIPNLTDAVDVFLKTILRIDRNPKTGLITVAVEWRDRIQAALWANLLVASANEQLRADAVDQAEKRIEFLKQELGKTSNLELLNVIYRLTEQQIQAIMLANTREEFAFQVIDPAIAPEPENEIRPRKVLMVVTAFGFALFLGILIAVLRGSP